MRVPVPGFSSISSKTSTTPCRLVADWSLPQCKLLAVVLNDFAAKYPMIKVLKIPGDQCIEGYPDRLMPTILVYGPKEFRSQVVGLADLGGNNTRVPGIVRALPKG
jgi:hypothetical protein